MDKSQLMLISTGKHNQNRANGAVFVPGMYEECVDLEQLCDQRPINSIKLESFRTT